MGFSWQQTICRKWGEGQAETGSDDKFRVWRAEIISHRGTETRRGGFGVVGRNSAAPCLCARRIEACGLSSRACRGIWASPCASAGVGPRCLDCARHDRIESARAVGGPIRVHACFPVFPVFLLGLLGGPDSPTGQARGGLQTQQIGTLCLGVSVRAGSGSEGCHPELVEGSGLNRMRWPARVPRCLDCARHDRIESEGGLLGANQCSFVSIRGWTRAGSLRLCGLV